MPCGDRIPALIYSSAELKHSTTHIRVSILYDEQIMYSYRYVVYSFVSLCILIVTYVPFLVFCFIVLFYVLFVCQCALYYCHRVSTQLQLNILYHITETYITSIDVIILYWTAVNSFK